MFSFGNRLFDITLGIMYAVSGFAIGLLWPVQPRPIDATAGKFCRDCRWAKLPGGLWPRHEFAHCMHPSAVRDAGEFFVTGKYTPSNMYYCSTARSFTSNDSCGPDGTHWEPRNPQERTHG